MNSRWRPLLFLALLLAIWMPHARTHAATPPNLIFILVDDLGYGDLGCYGQDTLQTPHLDRMAREGMRFTDHYAGSTVCAPSRCVLMTGLHTGHARIRGNGPGQLQATDQTIATVLRQAGYRTGCFGKWGIGNPPPLDDPNRHGFDDFYGYINMFHAHNFYPEFLVRNGRKEALRNRLYPDWKVKERPDREGVGVAEVAIDYAPQLIFEAAQKFIDTHQDGPFFLYYALNIPHANNEGGRERRIEQNGMRVPDLGDFAQKNWPLQEKGFARMIQTIDDHVGQILAQLKRLGIDQQTAVFFSSDNGPHQEGGHKMRFFDSNGQMKGMKRDLYEGGIRVPLIARWPSHIPSNQTRSLVSGFQDWFPTLAELGQAGSATATDGISLVPTLLGRSQDQIPHPHLYWEFYEQGGKSAVRQGNWKAVRRNILKNPRAPIELYNLRTDPGETFDVANDHPSLVRKLAGIMAKEHLDPKP